MTRHSIALALVLGTGGLFYAASKKAPKVEPNEITKVMNDHIDYLSDLYAGLEADVKSGKIETPGKLKDLINAGSSNADKKLNKGLVPLAERALPTEDVPFTDSTPEGKETKERTVKFLNSMSVGIRAVKQ
jgi:hypothetical protein